MLPAQLAGWLVERDEAVSSSGQGTVGVEAPHFPALGGKAAQADSGITLPRCFFSVP